MGNADTRRVKAADGARIAEWVAQAQAGNRSAFHRLVDLFQAEIHRMIYYRTRSQMDAEDLTQDVFLRAFKHIRELAAPALFRSWLYRIAVNRVRDHQRRSRLKSLLGMVSMDAQDFVETEELALPAQAPREMERQEFWRRVHGMLAQLSRMEREVFMLRFLDQLSLKEVSAALGKNENTVKTHLYRALHKLRQSSEARELWESI